MEGLEIREIKYSETLTNKDFRADSDFWTKAPKQNPSLDYAPIGSILKNSQYGISIEMNENDRGYPIYRMNEIHNLLCDFEVDKYADIKASDFRLFSLNDRDVLFNRTNSYEWVGRTGLFRQQADKKFVFASYLVRFVPDDKKVLPEYLVAFLSSTYGVWDIRRRARHSINQTNVNPEEVKEIQIPLLSNKLQRGIKSCFDRAANNLFVAKQLYEQAETLLLDTLCMAGFTPGAEAINIKSFKDSFAATGRLDAEYYQPKYEQIVDHITAQPHARLIDLVGIKKSIEPGSGAYGKEDDGLPFLRVADYSKYGITKPQKCLSMAFVAENYDELDALKPRKNTILFSKDGSVGEAYCLREDANFITSGAVPQLTVLDPDKVLPEYLTLALNSKMVKMQAERDAGGSIILHWRISEIEKVVVPLVDMPTQEKIAAHVKESFALKEESERLLDAAKRAVEIAIEQNEDAGISYMATVLGVSSCPNGWQPLMQACNLKDANFAPDGVTVYKYIELAGIDDFGGITSYTEALGNELPSRARRMVDAGDVLIPSVEGSLSSCAIVPEKMNGALCSTGFYVINSESINSETLLVLFKSPLIQNLLKQGCSGTILTAINKTEFQNIPVPLIEGSAQKKIAAHVKESFALKEESERLLDAAKRAVEIAIEQNEDAGISYMATVLGSRDGW